MLKGQQREILSKRKTTKTFLNGTSTMAKPLSQGSFIQL